MSSKIHVGLGDAGREFGVAIGDVIVLELPENPTTGVRWHLDSGSGGVRLSRDGYRTPPPGAGIGAAATRVLEFRAEAAGRFDLHLRRMQEWEGKSSADAEFSFTLAIGTGE